MAAVPVPTVNFRSIREHNGAQDEGFEELSYQLVPWLYDIGDRKVIRHGSPDGGIEARVEFEDGNVWGWQAKYFFQFGDPQFWQMKRSLASALASWPTLSRYTFVFPTDPPSGRRKGAKSAAEKIENAFAEWESAAAQQGRELTIAYVGGSRLRDILIEERHAGRVLYWFDQRLLFSSDWFRQKLDRAIDAAGPRYTPEVNVQLDVEFAFEGLGRTGAFDERLGDAVAALRRITRFTHLSYRDPTLPRRLRSAAEQVTKELVALARSLGQSSVLGTASIDWTPYIEKIDDAERCIEAISELTWRRLRRVGTSDGDRATRERLSQVSYAIGQLREPLGTLANLLRSEAARLVIVASLFLTGGPGTGKTHLLCDVASRRLKDGRPTVLVMGQQLGDGDPRRLILDHLDLPDMSMEQFLSALDAAGETSGTRALLMIDAINEGRGLSTWPAHLRSFVGELARREHVGLVASCRSGYVPGMLSQEPPETTPETIGFVEVEHTGFANHEWEASATFFRQWGLTVPDFPLLVPEYSNPLFLKLLCESLSRAGEKTLPRGATGVTRLFERFLETANHRLASPSRCNYREEADPVSKVVESLGRTMLETNRDWVPIEEFDAACQEALGGREWDRSLAKGFIDEGVVARDYFTDREVVRLSYQRLSDHTQTAQLIEANDDAQIRSFVAELEADGGGFYSRSGLLEALAIQLPEKRRVELHDLVKNRHHPTIREAFLGSIIWRDPERFDIEQLSDYVNSIANDMYWYRGVFVEAVIQVTCVPDHPFNADRLNDVLASMTIPDRDAWWTTHVNGATRGESVAWRLIDWARSAQQEQADEETVRLAGITLSWFLASSNRGLRDSATKALVTLLRQRVPVLVDLLGRFDAVDDFYITERLYCAAYGCALSSPDDRALERLAGSVFDKVFGSGKPPPHLLLRDYARGVIETAAHRGVLPPRVSLDLVRPPYESPWPVRPPSKETLDRRAPLLTHRTLHASLGGSLGDFSRYTVGGTVGHFEAPDQRRRRRRRYERERAELEAAIAGLDESLSADQRELLAVRGDELWATEEFRESFSEEQQRLLFKVQRPGSPRGSSVMWAVGDASRWIFGRVLDLGWTPERFQIHDEAVRDDSRYQEGPRTERIGKKYQWIALHELLASIADRCRYRPWDTADVEPYEGPWQLHLRDLDPSLTFKAPPVPLFESPRTWWQPLDVRIGPFGDSAKRREWALSDTDVCTVDDLRRLLRSEDQECKRWLTIEGRYSWSEDVPAHLRDPLDEKGLLWLQVKSYLVPRARYAEFAKWAHRQDWVGRWMPEGPELSQVFLGEWPWHPSASVYAGEQESIEPRTSDVDPAPAAVIPTWAMYTAIGDEAHFDGVRGSIPSKCLIDRQGLRWRGGSLKHDHPNGQVATLDPSADERGSSALLHHEAPLRELLDNEDVSLVWTVLGEKNISGLDRPENILVMSGVATLESSAAAIEIDVRTQLHP